MNKDEQTPQNINKIYIIYVHDGVEVLDSDCIRKIIVEQGFINKQNIPLICVPHHLSIIITTDDKENSEINVIAL